MYLYLTRPSTTHQLGATPYSDLASNPIAKSYIATLTSFDTFSNTQCPSAMATDRIKSL